MPDPADIAALLQQQWREQRGDQPANELKPDPGRLAFEIQLLRNQVTELERFISEIAQHVGYARDCSGS